MVSSLIPIVVMVTNIIHYARLVRSIVFTIQIRRLDVDFQVDCTDGTYIGFQVLAFIGVFAYPVGIPVLTLLALLRVTKSILAEDAKTVEMYEFLIDDYKPHFFYWDCLEMLRE